ncbi:MAG: site-specific integrase, partial [Pseudonocardiaceae bacterium]
MSEPSALPAELVEPVDAFVRHLRSVRGLSEHTVRAYRGDVGSLLTHLCGTDGPEAGSRGLADLDLGVMRSWLAAQRAGGAGRSTLARRAAAARTFTAWAARTGRMATDPGPRLASPRPHRALPAVLRPEQAAAALQASGAGAAEA